MPANQWSYFSFSNTPATNLPNGAETTVVTTRAVSSAYPKCLYGLLFVVNITTGAGATGVAFRVRENSLTGTVAYGPATIAAVASVVNLYVIACTDSIAGDQAGQVWVLTATVTGGAVAGTANQVYSSVTVAD